MYTEIMVDIESLATTPRSLILSIGAVKFNLEDDDNYDTLDDTSRCFHMFLNTKEQEDLDREISTDTIAWWMRQSAQARTIFNREQSSVASVLTAFNKFCREDTCLWGNGDTFDNVIIRSLYNDVGSELVVPFWLDDNLRTLARRGGDRATRAGIPRGVEHDALEDAKYQVLCAQAYFKRLGHGK